MVILAALGVFLILIGMSVCTQRIDNYWRKHQRKPTMTSHPHPVYRPFRTSPNQCVDCGRDDGPLSIDDNRCIWCYELKGQRNG
jgi:hypothetical protein